MTGGSVCVLKIQESKGAPATEKDTLQLVAGKGICGDRHFGEGKKQVCLSEQECHAWMKQQKEGGLCFARFHENIQTCGFDLSSLSKGDWLQVGEALLEITSVGKECFPDCPRRKRQQDCRLRESCCFARVIKDGSVALEDSISFVEDRQRLERYLRQLNLPGFGVEGQERLRKSRVLVIGAGGLGCPAVTALAEAGVGTIGIADGDVVELSNLNRQFFYTQKDIGRPKAECAAEWVRRFRPDCQVRVWTHAFGQEELQRELPQYDFVLDCVDSIETRALVNEMCVTYGIPFVDGAVEGMYGTVQAVLTTEDPCLSCINPKGGEPERTSISFSPVTMIIGALEAGIALKYLAGIFQTKGGLYTFDGKSMSLEEIPVVKNPKCAICNKK